MCRKDTFEDANIERSRRRARCRGTWLRALSSLLGSGLTMVFLLLASCDDVERHNALAFFFDGVPPLPGTATAPLSPRSQPENAASAPTTAWHIHEPVKDCTQCHGNQQRRGFSPKVQLVAEVPQLCYRCHKEFATLEGWVHGPVATGNCLLCHEPHRAKAEALLRQPAPDLCFRCHEVQAIHAVKDHAEPSYARCTDCHDGHAGAARSLLRASFLRQPAGVEYQSEIYRRQYEQSLRKARSDLAQGRDFFWVSQTILDYLKNGQWWPARAYLEVLLESDLLVPSEKPVVKEVLEQVTALQTAGPAERPADAEAGAAPATPGAALRALRERRSAQQRNLAELYYRSIKQFHAGQYVEAREGFRQFLDAPPPPGPMKETAQSYLENIERVLIQPDQPGWQIVK